MHVMQDDEINSLLQHDHDICFFMTLLYKRYLEPRFSRKDTSNASWFDLLVDIAFVFLNDVQ